MIFETHAHYDDDKFIFDRDDLLGHELQEAGIDHIVNVASDMGSVETTAELTKQYDPVYGALGVHPASVGELDAAAMEHIRKSILDNKKICAVGEIGFDYYEGNPEREMQEKWFAAQTELAIECSLPIIVHSRDAASDTYRVIRSFYEGRSDRINGVIHCFSYSREEAEKYIRLGFMIGVGGVVTFKNGRRLRETVEAVPLENIVLETDSPYLSPEPHRGERNTSANIPFIAAAIAGIKGIDISEVYRITEQNAMMLYGLQKGN